jgi:16S rRNA (adenine1518-N6/adenine1519-N6)-dimethyltransferase
VDGVGAAEIRALLARYDKDASRALGQNFLIDPNIARRIAERASEHLSDAARVIEVGPGLGSLTVHLAAAFEKVIAIELDRFVLDPLAEVLTRRGVTNVEVCHEDVMKVDLGELAEGGHEWVLASNLPYNVASQVIVGALERAPQIRRVVVMVQSEVADRLGGHLGTKEYSALSVKVQYFAKVMRVMKVPSAVFHPRPRVESAVVVLDRYTSLPALPGEPLYERTFTLVRAAFGHRRQMLRRSLAGFGGEGLLEVSLLSPTLRPEELSIDDWLRLGKASLRHDDNG